MLEKVFVSGYWAIPENNKHDLAHYDSLLPETLSLIAGRRLVFYSGCSEMLDYIERLCKQFDISVEPELVPFNSLPKWDLAGRMLESCTRMGLDAWPAPDSYGREKGVIHYWRDYKGSGSVAYRQLLAVWMSKISLVSMLQERFAHVSALAWIDVTLSRIRDARTNWRFWEVADIAGSISHYSSPMRYYGRVLPISAGYMSTDPATWTILSKLFTSTAEQAASMAYAHDEETILAQCYTTNPALFHCIGHPLTSNNRQIIMGNGLCQRLFSRLLRWSGPHKLT